MYPFIAARHFGPARIGIAPLLIVIHTMEAPEKPRTARNVALWFASDKAPQASTHYCIDSEEIIQCVSESDIAWAAPGANKFGVHLEHAGYASQTVTDWSDAYSRKMLERSAGLAADIARRHGIPIAKIGPEELSKNPQATGFCGHRDVTLGRNGGHGHYDPGSHFPWYVYLSMVQAAFEATDPGSVADGILPMGPHPAPPEGARGGGQGPPPTNETS
jgi:N-acetyl-anhydromuramyl-L-alanine amidase AmpD